MMNNNYQWGGMHLIWWFIWAIFLFWIFVLPYDIPGQRRKKGSPLDILQSRFASGEITKEVYEENKKILERDTLK
ncbi:MAG: SHOCT domain-containing protein [Ferruginibacter sp.]